MSKSCGRSKLAVSSGDSAGSTNWNVGWCCARLLGLSLSLAVLAGGHMVGERGRARERWGEGGRGEGRGGDAKVCFD